MTTVFLAKESFTGVLDRRPNRYVGGRFYTVRPGNDALACAAKRWASEGKIRFADRLGTATSSTGRVMTEHALDSVVR